jgi:hypothetical protein
MHSMNCMPGGYFDHLKRFCVILVWPQGGLSSISVSCPAVYYSCVDCDRLSAPAERSAALRHGLVLRGRTAKGNPMNGSEITAVEALANLFDSDASPVDVRNPQVLAETIVEFLIASGFKITSDDVEVEQ